MSLTLESLRDIWNREFRSNIRSEIRKEFDSLNASFRNLNRRFDELEKSQNFISTKYDTVVEAIQALKKQNQSVENQVHTIEEAVSTLNSNGYDVEVKVDELEQYGRRDCLEITGIPIVPDDNPVLLVQEMSAIMGVDLDKKDISIAHRLPPTKKVKDRLIVKFTRREKRDEIYSKRKQLKSKRTKICHLSPVSQSQRLWAIKPTFMSTQV